MIGAMMKRFAVVAVLALSFAFPVPSLAQITVNPGTRVMQFGSEAGGAPGRAVRRVGTRDLDAMSVTVVNRDPSFYLQATNRRAYGPFPYKGGSELDFGSVSYVVVDATDSSFSLKHGRKGTTEGPFEFKEKAEVKLGNVTFALRKAPAMIVGRLDCASLQPRRAKIALVALDERALLAVSHLKVAFLTARQRYHMAIQPVELNAPTIRGPTGYNYDPYVNRSDRDKERSLWTAQQRAKKSFLTFMQQYRLKSIDCTTPDNFRFEKLPAGKYLVLCTGDVKAGEGRKATKEPLFWLGYVELGAEASVRLGFTGDNGYGWLDLFGD
jgi:hypothetical protein